MRTGKLLLLTLLLCCLSLAPLHSEAKEAVILDTDMVDLFDDGVAMLMLAKSPQIELIGVTTVIGNTWAETGTASALRQLEGINRLDIPVAVGLNRLTRSGRIEYMATEKKMFGRGADPHLGAAGYPEPASWQAAYRANYHAEPKGQPVSEHGVDFLIRNIKARPHEITIVSIGTSANLAAAIRRAPEIVPLVKRVVYMGGAFFQQGNVMPAAEFNFWFDPEAARTALRAPFKEQIIFPLDVCEKIHFTYARYQEVKSHLHNPLFQDLFAHHWTKAMFDKDKNYYTFVWDVLAASMVVDPSLVTEARSYPVDVDTTYGPSYGQSLAFRGYGPEGTQTAKIVFSVDQDKLWTMIDKLCESL
jgi:inosine-uridine nucleoside N-ribohydrolase